VASRYDSEIERLKHRIGLQEAAVRKLQKGVRDRPSTRKPPAR
jgi:hypothetical protein